MLQEDTLGVRWLWNQSRLSTFACDSSRFDSSVLVLLGLMGWGAGLDWEDLRLKDSSGLCLFGSASTTLSSGRHSGFIRGMN